MTVIQRYYEERRSRTLTNELGINVSVRQAVKHRRAVFLSNIAFKSKTMLDNVH